MKIAILSMHRIANYGSFLQAYGLMSTLKRLGHEVEFADYKVEPCVVSKENGYRNDIKNQLNEKLYRLKNAIICELYGITYDQHKQFYVSYAEKYMSILGVTKQRNERPYVDVMVIGSDEVFNCIQSNPNVGCSMELFGKNSNANKIISYAASFGNTGIMELKKYGLQKEIQLLLNNFAAISVRDENSLQIVSDLMGKKPVKHLDPVLIYDFSKEMEKCEIKLPFRDYIVVYAYGGRISNEEGEEIKKFARSKGLKMVAVGGEHSFCDVSVYPNPFEVLKLIESAKYVITDTFHGTVFSIKFNKKFGTLIRDGKERVYGNREKIGDLLITFGLESQEIRDKNRLANILEHKINYTVVNKIIAENRKLTREYFQNVL